MSRGLRKFILTLHVVFTVGWLGAVIAFVALAIEGLNSQDAQTVSAMYISMDLIARYVIVPLSFAPLLTGPILSLGTPWGLFRHYWILAKLVITVLCTVIMQIHVQPIRHLADVMTSSTIITTDIQAIQTQMVIASIAAVVALLGATLLAIYKPKGMTPYGWRKQYEERTTPPDENL